jgi:serine/threonine protein kinase
MTSALSDPLPGHLIDNRFLSQSEIANLIQGRELGSGAYAVVVEGTNRDDGRRFAVKAVNLDPDSYKTLKTLVSHQENAAQHNTDQPAPRQSSKHPLLQEIEALRETNNCPQIVHFFGFTLTADQQCLIVMELCELRCGVTVYV